MVDKLLEEIMSQPVKVERLVINFYVDKKVETIVLMVGDDEKIGVYFDKNYVVVKTEKETKFVCKGKDFISLWC